MSRSRRPRALVSLVGVCLLALVFGLGVGTGASTGSPAVTGAAAPDTLFPDQGNPGYNVSSYVVRLDYHPRTHHLEARTAIRAWARDPLSSFRLDLAGLDVSKVMVDGRRATVARSGHKLVVRPQVPVEDGFLTVVTYSGRPGEHTDPDGSVEGWVRTPDGAIALGEPVGAMTWLPSNNTPHDKARYTFRVTVPSTLEVAANGVLASRTRHGATTTWVWREADPMATYLATVAIGHFKVHHSSTKSITGRRIPIWSFIDPRTGGSASARALLPKVIAFEERRFGPYPFTSAGLLVDNANVGYALETQSRPFFPYSADPVTLVHEVAHQWYGDSVTLVDWHDIWLAEGFATYAEWLWGAAHGGATPAERFDRLYATPSGAGLWHPAPTEFTNPADLFASPGYNRGAMTLQALRERVGTDDFFRILKAWSREHRHGSAGTFQFVALAERISGEDLGQLFADWLRLDGRPTGY